LGIWLRLAVDYTRRFGVEELHAVHLQHRDDRAGVSDAVVISVPEASRQEIKRALALARANKARVSIICDTADQAQRAYRVAARMLPDHAYVAMARAGAGAWGLAG
jgi:hypothetical protein